MKTQIQIRYSKGVNRIPTVICSCLAAVPGTRFKIQIKDTNEGKNTNAIPKGVNSGINALVLLYK